MSAISNIEFDKETIKLTQQVFNTSPDHISIIGRDYRYRRVNPAYEQAHGIFQGKIVGMKVADLLGEEIFENLVKSKLDRCLSGEEISYESWFSFKRGGRYMSIAYTPLRSDQGVIEGIVVVSRDLTERKQAEEELKKAHHQLPGQQEHLARLNESFVQALEEITYEYNALTDHVQWGGAYRRILGHTPEGMGNNKESWLMRIHPDDAQEVLQKFEQAIFDNHPFEANYRFKRRDNSYAWMHDRGIIHHNEVGQVEKVIGIMRDVTDRKKAEDLLRNQKLILELIAAGESLPTILNELCLSCEGQMSGLAASILLLEGDRLQFAAGPNLPEYYTQAIDDLLIGPVAGACGTAVYRKELVIVSDIATDPLCEHFKEISLRHGLKACWSIPIRASDSRILGTFAMYYGQPHSPTEQDLDALNVFNHLAGIAIERKQAEEDLKAAHNTLEHQVQERTAELSHANTYLKQEILERKQADEALQKSEARLQAILDNSPGLIFLKDLNGRYLHINRKFEEVFHLTRERVIGKTDQQVFRPEQAIQFQSNDHQVIQARTPLEFEETAIHDDGLHLSIVNKFPVLNEKGEPFAIGGITVDITERKRAEEALRESERFASSTMNALTAHVCVLDQTGTIIATNERWDNFAQANQGNLERIGRGGNYLADCDQAAEIGVKEAQHMAAGIRAVINKEKEEFSLDYPCNSGAEHRWFTGRVTRFPDPGPTRIVIAHQDITEAKEAETALQNRIEEIQDLYNNAPCGYHSLDADGRYIEVNDTELKWLGYTREEMIGKLKTTDIITPASKRQIHDVYPTFKEQGNVSNLQAEYIRKDGTILTGLVSTVAVRDERGQFLKSRTSVLDISALKEAEEALTESHLRFQRIFDEAGIGIVLVGLTGHVVESNPAFQHFLGYSLDELKTMAFPNFIHPDDTPNCLENYRKLLEGACHSYDLEERYIRKDGSVVWGSLTVTLLRNRQKEPLHAIAMVEDITERKRAEEERSRSRQAYQDLVNSLDGIVWECDFPSYKFTLVSKQAERLLGYSIERWLTDTSFFPNHIHEDDRGWALNYCRLATLEKRDHEREYRMIHANGQIIWLRDLVTVIVEDGQPVKLRGVMVDITQRKSAEYALREAQNFTTSIIENIPNMVFVKDAKDLRFVRVNKAGESLLGYKRADLLGKNDYDFFPPDEADFFTTNDRRVLEDGRLLVVPEEPIHTHERGLRFLHTKKIPLYDQQGHAQYLLGISEDITERKQSEEALAKTQQAYEDLVNSVEGIVWECEFPSYQVTFVSEPAERLLGYPVQEWLTDPEFLGKHLHPDDREWALAYCYQKTLEKQNHDLEYRMVASDERVVWLRNLVTVVIENDQPIKARGVMVDITERKRAEEQLLELNQTLEHAVEGISRLDTQGVYLNVNKSYADMLRYAPEELVGGGWEHTIHPDYHHTANAAYQEMIETGRSEFEAKGVCKDGSTFYKQVLMFKALDQQGVHSGHYCFMKDISERKQAEEALKQSEERFRTLASHAPVGIFLADDQGECLFVNEFLSRTIGLSLLEAQGKGWIQSLHTDDRERVVGEWKNATNQGSFFSEEYRFRRTDGGVSWVAGTAVPRESEEGQIIEYLGVCADITPLKHLENEIRKYAEGLEQEVLQRTVRIRELEQRRMQVEKLAALAQVAAGVAHEINNPLASISQSMTLFKRAISPRHHRYKYIGKVEECIERIAHIVKQLYQLNRPEPPIVTSNDLTNTVRNGVEIMKELAAKQGIKVVSQLPSVPIAAKISQSDIIQVLCNLIQNALDVSQPKDRISISVVPGSDTIAIRVRDEGPGISPEIAPHIFEPFFTTKSEAREAGMGLGLAISHNLIEAMGGTLDFTTSIGQGTTFTIKIPKT